MTRSSVRRGVLALLAPILLLASGGLFVSCEGGTATSTITSSGPSTLTIAKVQGDNQSAAAGTAVAIPPTVKVTGADGTGVAGIAVTFAAVNGVIPVGQSLLVVNTDANGNAAPPGWVLGTLGTNTMTATVDGAAGSPVTFTATGS